LLGVVVGVAGVEGGGGVGGLVGVKWPSRRTVPESDCVVGTWCSRLVPRRRDQDAPRVVMRTARHECAPGLPPVIICPRSRL
jgi:hypothetical protein